MSSQACYPEKAPAIDALLDTLSHHLRREIIYYFEECTATGTATLEELVVHVDQRVPSQTRERIWVQLTHVHLPKLDDDDWLDYDSEAEQIRYHGHERAKHLVGEVHAVL